MVWSRGICHYQDMTAAFTPWLFVGDCIQVMAASRRVFPPSKVRNSQDDFSLANIIHLGGFGKWSLAVFLLQLFTLSLSLPFLVSRLHTSFVYHKLSFFVFTSFVFLAVNSWYFAKICFNIKSWVHNMLIDKIYYSTHQK